MGTCSRLSSAGSRRLSTMLLQTLQLRGASVRLNRRYVCALSAAGLFLALLLLLVALWPGGDPNSVEGLSWLRRSRDARRYVRPLTSTALLSPPHGSAAAAACNAPPMGAAGPPYENGDSLAAQLVSSPPLRLLIMVTSSPGNTEARQTIRETWGGRSEDARLVFVLGRDPEPAQAPSSEIEAEAQRHGDILVEDFTDTYHNLTLKTLFMVKWALRECPTAAFVLKTDDDMLIHVRGLVRALPRWVAAARGGGAGLRPGGMEELAEQAAETPETAPPLVIGFLYHRVLPYRDADSKWYLPRWLFPEDVLPDFLSGTAYVMSRAALERLYSAALDTPLLPLEDVYFTGIVGGERVGVPLVHVSRFAPNAAPLPMPRMMDHPCLYHHLLAIHHFEPKRLRRMWNALVRLQPVRQCDSVSMRLRGRLFSPGPFQVLQDDPW